MCGIVHHARLSFKREHALASAAFWKISLQLKDAHLHTHPTTADGFHRTRTHPSLGSTVWARASPQTPDLDRR